MVRTHFGSRVNTTYLLVMFTIKRKVIEGEHQLSQAHQCGGSWFLISPFVKEKSECFKTILVRNDSVQRLDIHGEYESVLTLKTNVFKNLQGMFGALDVRR